MKSIASWFTSLTGKLISIVALIIIGNFALLIANINTLSQIVQVPERLERIAVGRVYLGELESTLYRLSESSPASKQQAQTDILNLTEKMDARYQFLLAEQFAHTVSDAEEQSIAKNHTYWQQQVKPVLLQVARADLQQDISALQQEARKSLLAMKTTVGSTVIDEKNRMQQSAERSKQLQISFGVVLLIIMLIAALLMRHLITTLRDGIVTLASASAELLAGTSQQAASAQEQAAAVAETVSTVDEVVQTAEQAVERATHVSESAQQVAEVSKDGKQAIDAAVSSMEAVRGHTEIAAQNILSLAERAQAIGEIISAVSEVAEQTNLLALNAGIEAARAQEHGAGFSVVAREIKALAEQARHSTQQVRQLLGEIQKATNGAVMVTEESSKGVIQTLNSVRKAGQTIENLTETIDEAAMAASQIAASAAQQSLGMTQIRQAMRDINEATSQTSASTKQAENAARDLNALGQRLKALLGA